MVSISVLRTSLKILNCHYILPMNILDYSYIMLFIHTPYKNEEGIKLKNSKVWKNISWNILLYIYRNADKVMAEKVTSNHMLPRQSQVLH